jgi:hypothetical protein
MHGAVVLTAATAAYRRKSAQIYIVECAKKMSSGREHIVKMWFQAKKIPLTNKN